MNGINNNENKDEMIIEEWVGLFVPEYPIIMTLTCPCGTSVDMDIGKIPLLSLKHPCENPNHWTVMYENARGEKQ